MDKEFNVDITKFPDSNLTSREQSISSKDRRSREDTLTVNGEQVGAYGEPLLSNVRISRSIGEGIVSKVLSLVKTKDSGIDPGPPPDGGFNAWLQVALGHLVFANSWGYINSFGIFETYHMQSMKRGPSDISWIGSVQSFLLFFIGTFSGRATDAGYFKVVWYTGATLNIFGIFMTSLVTTSYWELFIAQGLCMGIGCGLMFCPTLALVRTYFSSRLAIAMAVMACGTSTGGIVFPAIVERLLPAVGFPWTMRILGFVTLATLVPGYLFLRPRLPPRKSGPFIDLLAFKDLSYSLYAISMYLNFWGLYVGFFYVSSFGDTVIKADPSTSINLLMIMNAFGVIGRIFPSLISDWRVGPFNCIIPCTFAAGVILFGWIGVKDSTGLYIFSALYGFFAAGLQALFPTTCSSLTTDLGKTGVRFGMIHSIVGFASLTGTPIAGALIQLKGGSYIYAQIFAALSMLGGTAVLIFVRFKLSSGVFCRKV